MFSTLEFRENLGSLNIAYSWARCPGVPRGAQGCTGVHRGVWGRLGVCEGAQGVLRGVLTLPSEGSEQGDPFDALGLRCGTVPSICGHSNEIGNQ